MMMCGSITWKESRVGNAVLRRGIYACVAVVVFGVIVGCGAVHGFLAVNHLRKTQDRLDQLTHDVRDLKSASVAHEAQLERLRVSVEVNDANIHGLTYRQVVIRDAMVHLSPQVDRWTSYRLSYYTLLSCDGYGVDPLLFVALMYHESRYNPKAVSHAGAIGAAQVMPFHAKRYGLRVRDLYSMDHNIEVGVSVLVEALDMCNQDLACALGAYHGSGPKGSYARRVNKTYLDLLGVFDGERKTESRRTGSE